jgi:phosphoribosylglycinamide formyltransferase-1
MKIGLITYQVGHLKTIQLAKNFIKKKYDVLLMAYPFHLKKRKKERKIYQDRPNQLLNKKWEETSIFNKIKIAYMPGWGKKNLGEFNKIEKMHGTQCYICCTAKIIPKYYLKKRTFLNAHPGLLPQNRGVDAFKRSVLYKCPIGATLHIINEKIDGGIILGRKRLKVANSDNFKKIWKKNYLSEIQLLSDFEKYLKFKKKNWKVSNKYKISHKRIDRYSDKKINKIFLQNRNILIKRSRDLKIYQHPSDLI